MAHRQWRAEAGFCSIREPPSAATVKFGGCQFCGDAGTACLDRAPSLPVAQPARWLHVGNALRGGFLLGCRHGRLANPCWPQCQVLSILLATYATLLYQGNPGPANTIWQADHRILLTFGVQSREVSAIFGIRQLPENLTPPIEPHFGRELSTEFWAQHHDISDCTEECKALWPDGALFVVLDVPGAVARAGSVHLANMMRAPLMCMPWIAVQSRSPKAVSCKWLHRIAFILLVDSLVHRFERILGKTDNLQPLYRTHAHAVQAATEQPKSQAEGHSKDQKMQCHSVRNAPPILLRKSLNKRIQSGIALLPYGTNTHAIQGKTDSSEQSNRSKLCPKQHTVNPSTCSDY